jgi:hypothetical protein
MQERLTRVYVTVPAENFGRNINETVLTFGTCHQFVQVWMAHFTEISLVFVFNANTSAVLYDLADVAADE